MIWDGLESAGSLAEVNLADEQTWNQRTLRISIHNTVVRKQDDKMKVQMFGGRNVPEEMISERLVRQLSVSANSAST